VAKHFLWKPSTTVRTHHAERSAFAFPLAAANACSRAPSGARAPISSELILPAHRPYASRGRRAPYRCQCHPRPPTPCSRRPPREAARLSAPRPPRPPQGRKLLELGSSRASALRSTPAHPLTQSRWLPLAPRRPRLGLPACPGSVADAGWPSNPFTGDK
jgi:hypothetical protein